MRALYLLPLLALLCVSCGKGDKHSNTQTGSDSKDRISLQEAIDSVAEKPDQGKVLLAPEKIRGFDVAGMHLGMTQAEAEAKLAADGWRGKFSELRPGDLEEFSTRAFEQDNKELFLFRHRRTDGSVRIGEIKFTQHYELDHLASDIAEALIKKYGTPSINNPDRVAWRIRHEGMYDRRDHIGGASASHPCYRTDDPQGCLGKLVELEKASLNGPRLEAAISRREVSLTLKDPLSRQADVSALKAQGQKAEDERRRENGKAEKLGF